LSRRDRCHVSSGFLYDLHVAVLRSFAVSHPECLSLLKYQPPSPSLPSTYSIMSVNPSALSSQSSPAPEAGPSRKRPRSEVSSEERKEARAHRNRIAAQNSRDRRKAQFTYLERRVAELEEENRQLRLADEQRAADKARERENEELRERIKTLEKGWDAVVKALAANGVPTGLSLPSSEPTPAPPPQQPAPTPAPTQTNPPPKTESTLTQITPLSPAPSSHSSLDFDSPMFSPSSPSSDVSDVEPTRHLARVATTSGPVSSGTMVSLQRVDSISSRSALPSLHLRHMKSNLPSTTLLWKHSSAKSSLAPRRRHFYLLRQRRHCQLPRRK
ncbi:hypothetical protein F5146DRAFT_1023922, partial [Armillaria mellea]